MDYAKVDAALAAALASEGSEAALAPAPLLAVFVQLADEVAPGDREALAGLGLGAAAGTGRTCTATLTLAQVGELSDHPSVRRIQLSERLRLRQGPAST